MVNPLLLFIELLYSLFNAITLKVTVIKLQKKLRVIPYFGLITFPSKKYGNEIA